MNDITETDFTTEPPTVTIRNFTSDEIAQAESDNVARLKSEKDLAAAAAVRVSALAKLKKLGLTQAEIESL